MGTSGRHGLLALFHCFADNLRTPQRSQGRSRRDLCADLRLSPLLYSDRETVMVEGAGTNPRTVSNRRAAPEAH